MAKFLTASAASSDPILLNIESQTAGQRQATNSSISFSERREEDGGFGNQESLE